jgi:putative sugar O-methyltransferase
MIKRIINLLRKYNALHKRKKLLADIISVTPENLLNNNNFKENDITKCFAENIVKTLNTTSIDRIITSYKKAKKVQATKPIEYQVGNEWSPIYDMFMNNIITALVSEDKVNVNNIYENFMRDQCTRGLHGMPVDMQETYFGKTISKIDRDLFLYDAIYRYVHWKTLTDNKFNESDLKMPMFGNAYGYNINNKLIRTGAEYLHYYATEIQSLLNNKTDRKFVVELGGGYGGLAYFANKNISNVTYIDFDLPENMALTAYYLLNSFPNKKILLYGEQEFENIDLANFDIILMPNFEIAKLPTNKIDVVFNSYSLAEMSKETIDLYITELTRACNNYFLHVNHNKISFSYIADDFGIEKNSFSLVYKKPALWNLGRNNKMDEFEYLYKKNN